MACDNQYVADTELLLITEQNEQALHLADATTAVFGDNSEDPPGSKDILTLATWVKHLKDFPHKPHVFTSGPTLLGQMEIEPSQEETQELAIVPIQSINIAEAEATLEHEVDNSLASKEQLVANNKFRLSGVFGGRKEDLQLKHQSLTIAPGLTLLCSTSSLRSKTLNHKKARLASSPKLWA